MQLARGHANGVLRNFVATYWPNPGTEGGRVRSMYDRIAAATEGAQAGKDGSPSSSAAKENGEMNGIVVVKRE